ncbi:MAG: anaerobic ribonucleoside-triphosphate reductase activating protein [Candidatus Bathyarchaeia archaeon]
MKLPEIKGFIDVSLVDWDGKVSAVIFLPYCNFRCPFCYNTALVLKPEQMQTVPYEKVEQYLTKNRAWLDGTVITGGEPTTHQELPNLCERIKELNLAVKLDTNGTNYMLLQKLVSQGLVDYVAFDFKAPLKEEDYSHAVGVNAEKLLTTLETTVEFLLSSSVDYEFRTTLVRTIHDENSIKQICSKIKGCKKYVLQNFKGDVETLDPKFRKLEPFSSAEMQEFLKIARKIVSNTVLR